MESTHKMINSAARLTERANHCRTLNAQGLGFPIQNTIGAESNKRKARELILRSRKIRLARELTAEVFTHGMTAKAEELSDKLASLR